MLIKIKKDNMAFKLKSPFNIEITNVDGNLKNRETPGRSASNPSSNSIFVPMSNGEEEKTIVNDKAQDVEDLVKQADSGIPHDANPKKRARMEVRNYRKGQKDEKKFDNKTKQAEKIYKRNEFENVDGEILNPEAAANQKAVNSVNEKSKAIDRQEQYDIMNDDDLTTAEKEIRINKIRSKFGNYDDNIDGSPNSVLNMNKPNRAGRSAKSGILMTTPDNTAIGVKSANELNNQTLMSNIASNPSPLIPPTGMLPPQTPLNLGVPMPMANETDYDPSNPYSGTQEKVNRTVEQQDKYKEAFEKQQRIFNLSGLGKRNNENSENYT